MKLGVNPGLFLSLKKDISKGALQRTWLEGSRTVYGGRGNTLDDLPPELWKGFDRLLKKLEAVKINRNPIFVNGSAQEYPCDELNIWLLIAGCIDERPAYYHLTRACPYRRRKITGKLT